MFGIIDFDHNGEFDAVDMLIIDELTKKPQPKDQEADDAADDEQE